MDASCWGKVKGREQKIQDSSQAHQLPFEIGEAAGALPGFPLLGQHIHHLCAMSVGYYQV